MNHPYLSRILAVSILSLLFAFPFSGQAQKKAEKSTQRPAPEAPVTFMGVTLGADLNSISECPYEDVNSRINWPSNFKPRPLLSYKYGSIQQPCWTTEPIGQGAPKSSEFLLTFIGPQKNFPAGIKRTELHIVNGKIEGVRADTDGHMNQDELLRLLIQKFGPPLHTQDRALQNLMGAKVIGRFASWEWPDLHVSFLGIGNRIDSGYLTVETKNGYDATAAKSSQDRSF